LHYSNWYGRNVEKGANEALKIEIHIMSGDRDDPIVAQEHAERENELAQAGRGSSEGVRSRYRRATKRSGRVKMLRLDKKAGGYDLHDVPLEDIDEAVVEACLKAKYYEEAPGTREWMPRREKIAKKKKGKRREKKTRRGKRARRGRHPAPENTEVADEESSVFDSIDSDDDGVSLPDSKGEGEDAAVAASGPSAQQGVMRPEGAWTGDVAIRGGPQEAGGDRAAAGEGSSRRDWSKDLVIGKRRRR
jgi:hypothetical protein